MTTSRIVRLLVSFLVLCLLSFACLEAVIRFQTRANAHENPDLSRLILYSDRLIQSPHKEIGFRLYAKDAELIVSADIHLNNIGWIARDDFSINRTDNEYRIVILGGEQTASTTSSYSWPYFLEAELNKRYPSIKFRVLNFGWPDAGPAHYMEYWTNIAKKFSPDLVLVNYVESDFNRSIVGDTRFTLNRKPLELNLPMEIIVDEVKFKLFVAATKDNKGALSLSNPNVIASRPYGIFAPKEALDNKVLIKKLQDTLVDEQVDGVFKSYGSAVMLAFNSVLDSGLTNGLSLDVSRIRNFDPLMNLPAPIDKLKLAEFGINTFGWLNKNIPNVILIHSFNFAEIEANFEVTSLMVKKDPAIKVIDMRHYLPKGTERFDIKSWYQIPHMGEKWSERGHMAYSRLVADMLEDQKRIPVKSNRYALPP